MDRSAETGFPMEVDIKRGEAALHRAVRDGELRTRYPGKDPVRGVRELTVICKSASFPFSRFRDLEVLRVLHARAGHLAEIGRLGRLRWLNLDTKLPHLDGLATVDTLQHIIMQHADQLMSIDGLADLPGLRTIRLEGTPKLTELPTFRAAAASLRGLTLRGLLLAHRNVFRSFEPLAALTNLRYLDLRSVSADRSLRPLHGLNKLEYVRILPAFYTREEIAALQAALPGVAGNLHDDHPNVGARVR